MVRYTVTGNIVTGNKCILNNVVFVSLNTRYKNVKLACMFPFLVVPFPMLALLVFPVPRAPAVLQSLVLVDRLG